MTAQEQRPTQLGFGGKKRGRDWVGYLDILLAITNKQRCLHVWICGC
jgi:hypothetical protein